MEVIYNLPFTASKNYTKKGQPYFQTYNITYAFKKHFIKQSH